MLSQYLILTPQVAAASCASSRLGARAATIRSLFEAGRGLPLTELVSACLPSAGTSASGELQAASATNGANAMSFIGWVCRAAPMTATGR